MKVLVAVPVFNEEKYVSPVLREIRKYTRASALNDVAMNTRVLVVDDGSTDNTPAVVRDLAQKGHIDLITHEQNKGYGQSLIDAFRFAADHQYDWVITMDCDEQHEPCQIPLFIQELRKNDADIISGSRYLKIDADGHPPEDRRNINRLVTELLNTSLHLNIDGGEEPAGRGQITDAFCGFKAHRVSAMGRLQLSIHGYAFPMQFWVQVNARRLQIREIPVKLIYKDATRHFGGALDDPAVRFQHYLEVFATETRLVREEAAVTHRNSGAGEAAPLQSNVPSVVTSDVASADLMSDDLSMSNPPPSTLRPDPAKIIVPRKHAQVLIEPPMASLVKVMEDCRQKPGGCGATGMFAGKPMAVLKAAAQIHFFAQAVQWAKLTEAAIPEAASLNQAWVITGHQVEFYHAGVWAKVIAADELAKRTNAIAFDILVDHDVIDHLGFDVPTQEGELWKRTPIHWAAGADLPAEAIPAPTPAEFERWDTELAFHLHAHTDSLAFMLAALKPRAAENAGTPAPGSYVPWLSRARGKLERALDINVHHVPASLLCTGETWWTFLAAWIENAETWREVYNQHLAAYRKRQNIKNPQHPMPDLARRADGGSASPVGGGAGMVYELPFWVYKIGQPRQRLFIRKIAGKTTFLHDGIDHPLPSDLGFPISDFVIRPRALTLTMYARLFFADLFIHGIGGALYDQITDGILADLFGAAPPYACVSAAWLLPLGLPLENIDDIPQLKMLRHHILHNPQQALDSFTALKTDVAELITARKSCVEQIAASLENARKERPALLARRERFRELHHLNEQLHQKSPNILAKLDRQLAEAQRAAEQNKVLLWREYFYGLHTTHSLAQLIAKVRAG